MGSRREDSVSSHSFDEQRWVIQIRQHLDEDELEEDDNGVPVSIFTVPKLLSAIKPEAFKPQLVAIGPYHHWKPELYEMQRYKLSAARRAQKKWRKSQSFKLQSVVDQISKFERRIRACYHRYLDLIGETLAWMMAVDACFLLEFLKVYGPPIHEGEGRSLVRVSSRMAHLVDFTRRKSAHNAIVRDLMMMENQIPLFLLRKLLELENNWGSSRAEEALAEMVSGFCAEISPMKIMAFSASEVAESGHLLDVLYRMMVPWPNSKEDQDFAQDEPDGTEPESSGPSTTGHCHHFRKLLSSLRAFFSSILSSSPFRQLQRLLTSRPLKLLLKLPRMILTSLPLFSFLKAPLEFLVFSDENNDEGTSSNKEASISKPPLMEELHIPSVTDLCNAGVTLSLATGGISSIQFDPSTGSLSLPSISLDVNSEIIIRNLVAFEAASAPGPLIFTRYTELMNGIIDTEKDVALMRERGILLNRLKSDEEAAELWNGMSRSVRLTKVEGLDRVIEEVNKYYGRRWRVVMAKFVREYVYGWWRGLTVLAAVALLLLTAVQAFCSVYICSRWLSITATPVGRP
ncbi:putative UPF0481 protein At3g02645 [Amborella trichopoda]|uniref:Uncharacterized protein n=1 Tax=Amborella trichopoda TaxID=13333 RepID=U5D1N7_AMBTC|nr:putative UPF0481 protein At3g02645 [Amborella trichopoda]ERN14278.1 hypothetical protein AMTR_s00033p00170840 [Amborella trichopoda]|eukprot:XP_006852811.1 putative UPF0481 protein At3g02645 [Amborella trichopoda]